MLKNRFDLLLLSACLLFGGLTAYSQNTPATGPKDYASYPYWMHMMQDPYVNFHETQKAFYAYWADRKVTRGSGYKPFKRWEYFWQPRVNPDGTFPEAGKVCREYNKYVQSNPLPAGFKTGQAAWRELGPRKRLDYGGYLGIGRVNAVAFHPTDTATVYVGAPNGGFWITHDGGRTWGSPSDKLPSMGVSAILVNPVTPNIILIGTGDRDGGNSYGLGVFRSEDSGLTWQPSNTGMGNITIGMFAQPQSDPQLVLAAGVGGIYKSVDGGQNWVRTSPDQTYFQDIKFRPGSSRIAYATSNAGFYRTEDSGDTWTLVPFSSGYPSGGRLVIGVTPASDNLVFLLCGAGAFVGCYVSGNMGVTFLTLSTTPNILGWAADGSDTGSQAFYDLIIHVDENSPLILYAGGINLWKSIDGGIQWKLLTHWSGDRANLVHADQHTFAFNPLNKRLYLGNDGGIWYTSNQGTTWKDISEGLGIGQLYKIGISNTEATKLTGGFQDNGSATMVGSDWVTTGGGDGFECAVDPYDPRYSYTSIYYGSINRFYNNGYMVNVASKGVNGITEDGGWVTPFLIGERDGNTMVVGYKNIWISRNIKAPMVNWTQISSRLANADYMNMAVLEQSPADINILYAAREDGKLFRTDDLLRSHVEWTDISSSLSVPAVPADLECSPYDPATVYMVLNGRVYKSITRGASWKDISGNLPEIYFSTIVLDKTSDEGLYVGSDAGTFYKDAGMTDWVMYGESFPVSVGVTELEIYYDSRTRSGSILRASTYGRGVWEVKLAGSNAATPPYLLTADLLGNDVELNWNPPFYAQNVYEFRIYRNGMLLAAVTDYTYTDYGIQPDITYTYQVKAMYTGGPESGFSNEAYATITSPIVLPYHQTFERSNGGFTAKYALDGWNYGTGDILAVPGRDGHFFAANSSAAGQGVLFKDYLMTPEIDLSGFTGKPVTLKFAYTLRRIRTFDKLSVNYRTSPDSAWIRLSDLKPPAAATWMWDTIQFDLPARVMTSKAQIGFLYDNSHQLAGGAAVDDVELFLSTTSVRNPDNTTRLKVFPNPGPGLFTIELISGFPGKITLRIFNIAGQVVLEKIVKNYSGTLTEMIDLSGQPKGVYQLIIQSDSARWQQKITIQ
ncbi:MAG: T9SS type A sorting domain-containing protein [Bacteroidales bacterium]